VEVEEQAPARKLALGQALALARRLHGAFDIVHTHGPRATFWGAWAARRAGVPGFVVTQHESRDRTMPPGLQRAAWVFLEERSLSRTDVILAVSEATARHLSGRRPRLASRIRVVHGTAPMLLDAYRLPRAETTGTPGEPFRLVSIGRFDPEKGNDRLFQSLARLAARGFEFTLDLVGHGILEEDLHALADRLGIGGRIRWHRGGPGLPELLARGQLYVTATRNEGLSVAGLEAMGVGLPTVMTAVGGNPELVVDGVTGVLLAPEPEATLPDRLADAIVRCAGDDAARALMGEASARRAREVFGPARMAREVTTCYREVLARAPRRA
jgi:glycosyltransferase involved in cell wall biosynthesis